MNTTAFAARIGTTEWMLTGISTSSGQQCGHCPRILKNLYTVKSLTTGETMAVGRGCCKKVTGWTLSAAEAQRLMRAAAIETREDTAFDRYGDDYRLTVALAQFDHPFTAQVSELWVEMRDGGNDYYRDHLMTRMGPLLVTLGLDGWALEDIEIEAQARRAARLAVIDAHKARAAA